ncbi:hypothetical protein ABZY90_00770 [Streptomyces sp. NPDC006422]|uniref:hypothetical protein n=1 Tax=unclassified Streptomyces TaxID=2593676 RepID=UPI0033A421D0
MAPLGMRPLPVPWLWLSLVVPSPESPGVGPWACAGMVETESGSTWCTPGSGVGVGAPSGGVDGVGSGPRWSGIDAPWPGLGVSAPSGRLGAAPSGVVSGVGDVLTSGVVPVLPPGEGSEDRDGSLPGGVLGAASGVLSGRAWSGVLSGAGPPSMSGVEADGVDESGPEFVAEPGEESGEEPGVDESGPDESGVEVSPPDG